MIDNIFVIIIGNQINIWIFLCCHGPLTSYVKLRVAHALGVPGTFSPPPNSMETASLRFRYASRHVRHAHAVMHVGIAKSRWRWKRSRHSRRMRNPQFYVSEKRSMLLHNHAGECCSLSHPIFAQESLCTFAEPDQYVLSRYASGPDSWTGVISLVMRRV